MNHKVHTLRALVNARLTAAAEEIFALVERTIAEYEEELCRSKEENQRNQQLLDSVLKTQNLQLHSGVSTRAASPDEAEPRVKPENGDSPTIKEEPEEFCFVQPVHVKSEEPCPLTPAAAHGDDTPGEHRRGPADANHSPNESADANRVWSKLWEPPATSSTAQTEADGDRYDRAQTGHVERRREPEAEHYGHAQTGHVERRREPEAERYGHAQTGHVERRREPEAERYGHAQTGHVERRREPKAERYGHAQTGHVERRREPEAERYGQVQAKDTGARPQGLNNVTLFLGNAKVHECSFCEKRFTTNQSLQIHIRVHTGEKPYSCPFCKKCFTQKAHLKTHIRTHTKEKPYRCSLCLKSFMHKVSLNLHMEKTHPDFVG